MQAAHMSFEEETLRLRAESKRLRLENAQLIRSNKSCLGKIMVLEQQQGVLKQANHQLSEENKAFKTKQAEQEKALESLRLIVEELRRMIFGKKKTKGKDEETNTSGEAESGVNISGKAEGKKRKKANRNAASYRRPTPAATDVTDCTEHKLTECPDCGTTLIHLKQIIRYIEDLVELTQ